MSRYRRTIALVSIAVSYSGVVTAQNIPEIGNVFGNVVNVSEVQVPTTAIMGVMAEEPTKKTTVAVVPAFVKADNADIYGATLSLGIERKHEFQARALRIKPESADGIDQYRVAYKRAWPVGNVSMAGVLRYTDTEASSETTEAILAVERSFRMQNSGKLVILSANIKWKDREFDNGSSIDDFGVALGLATVVSESLILGLDYEFEDDVNDDDIFSITAVTPINFGNKNVSLVAGLDDDKTITLAVKFVH